MLFSETMASLNPSQGDWIADIGDDWGQGRASFGGVVAALGNEAMRRLVPPERALRALDTVFVGPCPAGPVKIRAQVLRVGKAVTIASARLWSADTVAATQTGVYGAPRVTAVTVPPATPAPMPAAEHLPDSAPPPQFAPSFLQHFGIRWAEGARPFSGAALTRAKSYIRHSDSAPLTESHVVALCDCIPSIVLQMMRTPAPSSSLTWSLQFLEHDYGFAADSWWRIDAEIDAARGGYSCESSVILNPSGAPAVLSRQLIAVFG